MALPFKTTAEINIPKDPFERIIGQERAVKFAKIAAKQKRNLLLVGPPGTGKSLIAKAMASILAKPRFQISVFPNEKRPERPVLKIETREEIDEKEEKEFGKLLHPFEVPPDIAEELGYRCRRCYELSAPSIEFCPACGAKKQPEPLLDVFGVKARGRKSIEWNGLVYEAYDETRIRVLSKEEAKRVRENGVLPKKKVLVPLNRQTFVQAVGASEAELFGDVEHDPYGGHPELGIPPYLRVVPGAIHEAHEGLLFIDELSSLSKDLQKSLLTAMQEKKFPIVGRSPGSTGAMVKVEDVPCDFILVGALNMNDLGSILPALRNRIKGDGYEVLMEVFMEDNEKNRQKIAQFVAQEIVFDGRIPHAKREAVEEIIAYAKRVAKSVDGAVGLTLRLRTLSGVVRLAGDIAVEENSKFIEKEHVKTAIENAKSIEEQISEKYSSSYRAGMADYGAEEKEQSGIE
jgi:predicted ATP-dependent protease